MNNNFKFFENKECEYYPCHKGIDNINCLFCYCPFYAWEECPGKNEFIKKADGKIIKVCTNCNFPHIPDNRDKIMDYLRMGQDEFIKMNQPLGAKFYGIGVGPGEPSLITLQAKRVMKSVDVLILPAKDKEKCRAYAIASKAVREIEGKECMFIPFPMSMEPGELNDFHKDVANKVEKCLKDGKSVGFLSIGDVTIYSTFAYIEQIVADDGFETEYVNGIPSFSAASARLATYLTLGNDEMHIIPGSADIDKALSLDGTLVFMKSGKRLVELKERLLELEKEKSISVAAVSNCGMENEIISKGATNITEESGYLTVVIVKQ